MESVHKEDPKRAGFTLFDSIPAGFPSPAADYAENSVDLNRFLIRRQASTFLIDVRGSSMTPTANNGDRVVVDKSIKPMHGDMVIAEINGGFTLKRLYNKGGFTSLTADNDAFSPIVIDPGETLEIWGVVTFIIHRACMR